MEFTHTSHPEELEFPKLVRDNIPDMIAHKTGAAADISIAQSDAEYFQFLVRKLSEEAREVGYSIEHGNTQEELADIYEVINAILELKGWSREEIVKIQNEKLQKNGGFSKRYILNSLNS